MVTIEIVINPTRVMGIRVIISCRYCIAFEVMLLFFSLSSVSRSESWALCFRGVHSSNKHCVAVCRPISTRFSAFFQNGLLFQMYCIVLIFVARWFHNFREIAVKNCEKSKNRRKRFCAPLTIDSWEIWRKFHRSSLVPRRLLCTYNFFSACRYIAPTATVKLHTGVRGCEVSGYCW